MMPTSMTTTRTEKGALLRKHADEDSLKKVVEASSIDDQGRDRQRYGYDTMISYARRAEINIGKCIPSSLGHVAIYINL